MSTTKHRVVKPTATGNNSKENSSVKTKSKPKSEKTGSAAASVPPPSDSFPFAQYVSVLGVHLLLVGFAVFYLPQTTRLFGPLATRKTDRPQSEFIDALTANPLFTLGWIAGGLTVLQVWWANWMRSWSFKQTAAVTEAEKKLDRAKFDGLWFTKLKEASAFTLSAAFAAYIVFVFFGAPLTSHVLHTALIAFVVAILATFTPAFVLGFPSLASDTASMVNRLTWMRLFAELSPRNTLECAMVYPAIGTVIGGWLGAIPIALDWDRPWQAWPLTPLFGSIGGYVIGAILALASNAVKWLAAEHVRSQPSKPKRI